MFVGKAGAGLSGAPRRPLSAATLSITTLSIMGLFATLGIIDTLHK